MKNWMKMAAMLLAVTMMACGCSNGTAAPSDTPETAEEQTEAASEAETAGADEAAPEVEGEQVEVDLSAGLDEEGNVLDMDTKDYLTLPDYKTVTFADADVHPNEDQIQQQVDTLMSNYADKVEVKDR